MDNFNKTILVTGILLALGLLFFHGCASIPAAGESDPVAAYLPAIKLGSAVATGTVLKFAETDAAKRAALANQIYATASGVRTLCAGGVPTQKQLAVVLAAYNTDATVAGEYGNYVDSVSAIYAVYYPQIQGKPKYATEVLEALASGAEMGAKAYISVVP